MAATANPTAEGPVIKAPKGTKLTRVNPNPTQRVGSELTLEQVRPPFILHISSILNSFELLFSLYFIFFILFPTRNAFQIRSRIFHVISANVR